MRYDEPAGLDALRVMLTAFSDQALLKGFQTLEPDEPKYEIYIAEMAKRDLEF